MTWFLVNLLGILAKVWFEVCTCKQKATTIVHGATGKGNDQVCFGPGTAILYYVRGTRPRSPLRRSASLLQTEPDPCMAVRALMAFHESK